MRLLFLVNELTILLALTQLTTDYDKAGVNYIDHSANKFTYYILNKQQDEGDRKRK